MRILTFVVIVKTVRGFSPSLRSRSHPSRGIGANPSRQVLNYRNDNYFDNMQNTSILVDIFLDRVGITSTLQSESQRNRNLISDQPRPSMIDLPRKTNMNKSNDIFKSLSSVEINIGRLFMVGTIMLLISEFTTGRSSLEALKILLQ